MRLLRRKEDGGFEVTGLLDDDAVPKYAILSHTWLLDNDQEVTYHDIGMENIQSSKPGGYAKIQFCADRAAQDGLDRFWVDTCCINKESSAELQEAITSMFTWYRNSAKCYAYLTDVSAPSVDSDATENREITPIPWEKAFKQSRWFTRGWTLQELLAPASVEFFSREGALLGSKTTLEDWLHGITSIPRAALCGVSLENFSSAEKLSWTENRHTKRKEDRAYCLFGIFNVFMPHMYGEGGEHAFSRLEEQIKKRHDEDQHMDEMVSWLPIASEAAFNSGNNRNEATCLSNTRAQLLKEIKEWAERTDDKCIYWLSGIAGTGKSTVARTIARNYHELAMLGASFFFSKGGGDVSNAQRAISRQKNIADQSFRDQWDQLIAGPLSRIRSRGRSCPPSIVLVIDAMDECDSERDIRVLLRVLASARSLTNIRLRIFLTSRPEIAIRHSLGKIPDAEREIFVLHEISDEVVNRDLSLYFESNFSVIREERGLDDNWPGKPIIERLVQISGGPFIWASTACRFIREGRRFIMKRVITLLNGHRLGEGPEKQLDQIYIAVIRDSIHQGSDYNQQEKAELYQILREILGSIVVLSSPLSMISLARLLNMPLHDIKETLADFHTIFNIPSRDSKPIRLHHPTFRDFLLDKERSTGLDFSVDEKEAHAELAEGCLRLMTKMLKRDICGLGSPGTLVKDVDPDRTGECIPNELQYACLYWVQHYRQSGKVVSDGDEVHLFFQEYFLYWVEAICLMGKSAEMGAIIRLYHSMLEPDQNRCQMPFVKDTRRFLFTFQNIIKLAPLQTYCAALAFVRPTNQLKQHFRREMHPWIKDLRVVPANIPKAKDEFNYVNDLAFRPDGRQVASGSNNEIARLWDVPTRTALWRFEGPTDKVSSVAISPDGSMIAAGSDDFAVTVWDLKTRALRYFLPKAHLRWVNSVIFSPNGKLLASGSMDETVAAWEAATGKELIRIDNQSGPVNTAAFSPDGTLIATGSVDQVIRLWNISGKSEEAELLLTLDGHSGCVNSVRFSAGGDRLISGSDDTTIKIWDTAAGTELMSLRGHSKKVMAVTYSPDARLIVSGSEDMTVRVWEATTGSVLHTVLGHTSGINAVVFSPDGQFLASGSFNDDIRLWDSKTFAACGQPEDFDSVGDVNSAHSSSVTSVTFSRNGQVLASGSEDGTIKVWLNEVTKNVGYRAHSSRINNLAFSPNSSLLASSSDKTVSVWDVAAKTLRWTFAGHSDDISSVAFSGDGKVLASCSADTTTRLWDVETGAAVYTIEGHKGTVTDVVFSPHSRILATSSEDTTILIWDLDKQELRMTLTGHTRPVNSVAFSPDGEFLASCSEDGTIRLWCLEEGAIPEIVKYGTPVSSIAISPDSKYMASSGADEKVGLWDLAAGPSKCSLDTGILVKKVSFSGCGKYIYTDRGTLKTDSCSLPSPPSSPFKFLPLTSPNSSNTLFLGRDWVTRNMENFIWLPDDFQVTVVANRGESVAMGHSSGAITFIAV
ncbi:WD40-repeat-containing domain protein [Cladorrhinum sp. PSN332]|nr:WD40-repeat-containing domain protein [Cladorrhinum sp. PSN332]